MCGHAIRQGWHHAGPKLPSETLMGRLPAAAQAGAASSGRTYLSNVCTAPAVRRQVTRPAVIAEIIQQHVSSWQQAPSLQASSLRHGLRSAAPAKSRHPQFA